MEKITCTAPNCKKCLKPEELWLPELKALSRANGGVRVDVEDFPKFALCGYHGHLLRQSGVRVYRYLPSVEHARKAAERRASEDLSWKPFADRFAPKAKSGGKAPAKGPGRGRDGRGVGQGLSRCAKQDAAKRAAKAKTEGSDPASS